MENSVDGHGAKWAKGRRPGFVVFTKRNLKNDCELSCKELLL